VEHQAVGLRYELHAVLKQTLTHLSLI